MPELTRTYNEAELRRSLEALILELPQEVWEHHSDLVLAALDEIDRLREAARALYEEVEMAESVGICLPDRVSSLRLGEALR